MKSLIVPSVPCRGIARRGGKETNCLPARSTLAPRRGWRATGLAVALVFSALAGRSPGAIFDVQLNQALFGHVDQANVPASNGASGVNSCVPTATANSFQYLQSQFGSVYGANTIIPAGKVAQDVAIDLSKNYMSTDATNGTLDSNWLNGKKNYLEAKAPGKTVYSAEGTTLGNFAFPNYINGNVTFSFLYNGLQNRDDIELGYTPAGGGIGHALTLTSLHWDNRNGADAAPTATNPAQIDFIDPAGGVFHPFTDGFTVWADANGVMQTSYGGGGKFDLAITEVAIPEPASLALLTLGCALLLARRRREAA
jgi:hypothetical protein